MRVSRRSARARRALLDDLEGVLDTFEANVRLKWSVIERKRYAERQAEIRAAMHADDPWTGPGASRSLTYYDGHVETHGQDV